ncbi:hypothetical protein F444_00650 [Phytophthora nicotianae P1976]|uniref:PiggyBac transposable element-derived protein domain-containing protein n=1 Tax=Phytophthora nicotianae P1976 TaxID=1317066 RepID=A0A081B3K4_PHYNI|nr:hypothetical protein F444_00650 [Phytophthora nicotianae P1976]
MAFASRWRELKKDGWRSRRPTGLSNDFTYLKPGKTKKDVRRTDYFVGEEELMRYLDTLDLAELAREKQRNEGHVAASLASESSDKAHAGSAGSAGTEQPAGEAAHENSADAGEDNNNAVIVEGSPLGMSYSSADESVESNESESLPGSSRNPRNLESAFQDADVTSNHEEVASSNAELTDEADLVGDGYVRLESDSENDEGVSWDADDLLADNSHPLDDEEIPPPPEMLFDRSLLDAVGGVGTVERGSLPIELLGEMAERGWSAPTTQTPYDYLMEPYEPRPTNAMLDDYPRLYQGEFGPTSRALLAAATPSGAFLYFAQPALWDDIASASEDYYHESLDDRVEGQFAKQVARETKHPGFKRKTREQIREELEQAAAITGRELCVFIGLLIARSVCPNKEKLENHWKTVDEGAIPRGCFGQFMVRDRFMHISRNLHFSSNSDERARTDKAWKLRPVIDALQARFQSGYIPPAVMAFDEAMLPSRSSFNKMRVYMKDKPRKWGTKLFMLCCSTTAYCIRFEVYLGKQAQESQPTDYKSGPAAVTRNLEHVFGPTGPGTGAMRLVVTDRYYTSVPLAMQMLTKGYYTIGTIRTDRRGLPVSLVGKKAKKGEKKVKAPRSRPANIDRGTYTVTESNAVPGLRALRWWLDRVVRRDKLSGQQAEVACPRILKDYQTFMGGVDVHDQLRLQRYSLQLAIKYKKYYKSLFLGLVDLAIINAYIVYNQRRSKDGLRKVSHVKFLKQLHLELCQLRDRDWESLRTNEVLQSTPARAQSRQAATRHMPVPNNEWRPGNNHEGRKRRTRACKVCSLMKGVDEEGVAGGGSSIFCSDCKLKLKTRKKKRETSEEERAKEAKARRSFCATSGMLCFDIWHKAWKNGTSLPSTVAERKIRARIPADLDHADYSSDDGSSRRSDN